MRTNSRRWNGGDHPRYAWRQALVMTLTAMLWLPLPAMAENSWQVDDAHGVLHVNGEITESACRLEMVSAYQSVWLGGTSTAQLVKPGDRGVPVDVQLLLRDCLRSPADSRDERNGNRLWIPYQPAVSVSFIALADVDNPKLVKVRGASGVALRMTDERGRDIRLGSRGAPLALAVGQNALNYTITLERTPAPLLPGAYAAVVDFQLSYD